MVTERARWIRLLSLTLASAGLTALAAALVVLMVSVSQVQQVTDDELRRRVLALLSVVLGLLLIVIILAGGMLAIRTLGRRLHSRQRKRAPTPYVDAWELSGQRMPLDPNGPREDPPTQGRGRPDGRR